MSPAPTPRPGTLRRTLEMVRFSHSVFALPFALLSLFLAADGRPGATTVALVVVAMVAARSAAMGVNRIADRRFDAENPRTAGRHLVTGALSVRYAAAFTAASALVIVGAATLIHPLALALSPLVLAVLFGYSFLKRFTLLAHLGVGLALGLSPLGAWIAGAGGLEGDLRIPLVLGAAVMAWVAGFDVIYACQDAEVDRRLGLHSIPARLGIPTALAVSAVLHLLCVVAFAAVGLLARLSWAYGAAVGLVAVLLAVPHLLVPPRDRLRADAALLPLNGFVSLLLSLAGIADLLR